MTEQIYTDIMCDLESNGTSPDRNSILQIAAVKFNLETGDVSPEVFNRCLTPVPWRPWDQSTKIWWEKNPGILNGILLRGEDPKTVMNDLFEFANPSLGGDLRFWGKPISFDYAFVSSYFKDFNVPNPFSYRKANDLNTFLRSLYWPHEVDTSDEPEFVGPPHDALYDTFHQTKVLLYHTRRMKGSVVESTEA